MNQFMKANKEIERAVVTGYKAIENGVVSGYKAIENGVVGGYKKVENAFVKTFLSADESSQRESEPAANGQVNTKENE